jgi:EAL domain-containing protein (putative c-di-GMP-specific phosphodiesterase class I)
MKKYELLGWIIADNLINTVFQPIVKLDNGAIMGYEALSRGPEGTELYSPLEIIKEVKIQDMISDVDSLFVRNAFVNAKMRGIRDLLFINIEPVAYEYYYSMLTLVQSQKFGIDPERIVIEITERSRVSKIRGFKECAKICTRLGMSLACDDFGSYYSNFDILRLINPKYIKVDRSITRGIDREPYAQAILKSLLLLADLTGITPIVEGVETKEELMTLLQFGVKSAQGYFLAMPGSEPYEVSDEALSIIHKFSKNSVQKKLNDVQETQIMSSTL